MGEYFRIVNPAKEQYLENPLSDNKWHNILAPSTDTVRILNYLICQGTPAQGLAGSWSGDALFIVGDESTTPDEFGVPTATKKDPKRTLYRKAEQDYESILERGDAMLDDLLHQNNATDAFLVANLDKKQYIDPLCFADGTIPEEPLGGIHGQAVSYLCCRFTGSDSEPGFGTWSKDRIVLVPERANNDQAISYLDVLNNFENAGYLVIRMLEESYRSAEHFPMLANINPRFLSQLRLANTGSKVGNTPERDWISAAENLSQNERKGILLKNISSTVGQWAFGKDLLDKLTERMQLPVTADKLTEQHSATQNQYLEALQKSLIKRKEEIAAQDGDNAWKEAYSQMQKVYEAEAPCGITIDDITQLLESTEGEKPKEHSALNRNTGSRQSLPPTEKGSSRENDFKPDAHGNIDLKERQDITALPDGLTVTGGLSLLGCSALTALPTGLTVGHDLTLTRCVSLTSLPEGLRVGRSLNLTGCTQLSTLPNDISIGGNLSGHTSGITTLPETLSVGGMIDLRNTPISKLPKSLKVGSTLELDGCIAIRELPENLWVGGDLRLCQCNGITKLPEGLTVKGIAYFLGCYGITKLPNKFSIGTLLLDHTSIKELPERLSIDGSLSLANCKGITELPETLFVGKSLNMTNCIGISRLPEKFSVGESIIANGCVGIKQLPPNFKVNKNLGLQKCTGLTELPDGLIVSGDLDISGCIGLDSLPEGLQVSGDLDATNCSQIKNLPKQFSVGGSLILTGCAKFSTLPSDLMVNGNLILKQCTGLKALPERLQVKGYLDLRGCSGITVIPDTISIRDNIIDVDAFDPDTVPETQNDSASMSRLAEIGQMLQKPDGMKQLIERAQQAGKEQMDSFTVEGTSSGGKVKIRSTGNMVMNSVEINKDVIKQEEVAALERLVLAALNDVAAKTMREIEQIKLRALIGAFKI